MHRLILHPAAEADLQQAYLWYEERRTGLGQRFVLSVEASLSAIQGNPLRFPVVYREVRRALIRRLPYGVYFVVELETVVVISVYHSSRNPRGWMDRT